MELAVSGSEEPVTAGPSRFAPIASASSGHGVTGNAAPRLPHRRRTMRQRSDALRSSSAARRLLPTPGSPSSSITEPAPARQASSALSSTASSSVLPTKGAAVMVGLYYVGTEHSR